MIYLLHGEDTQASYARLQAIISSQTSSKKIVITQDNIDLLTQAIFSSDLFNSQNIVVLEDLINSKKVKASDFKNLPKSQLVILWEKFQLPTSNVKAFQAIANIENFKPPSTLFYFLDSIAPNSKKALYFLAKLEPNIKSIPWHLENRLLLLILAKLKLSEGQASQISGRNIAAWQWQKIANQANMFELKKLKDMFANALKIETLIKTGATTIAEKTLINLMLTKHLV